MHKYFLLCYQNYFRIVAFEVSTERGEKNLVKLIVLLGPFYKKIHLRQLIYGDTLGANYC